MKTSNEKNTVEVENILSRYKKDFMRSSRFLNNSTGHNDTYSLYLDNSTFIKDPEEEEDLAKKEGTLAPTMSPSDKSFIALLSSDISESIIRTKIHNATVILGSSITGIARRTNNPTSVPVTNSPTVNPTIISSLVPSSHPSIDNTNNPTVNPTIISSLVPSSYPSIDNTNSPTVNPTTIPTLASSLYPSIENTNIPTIDPTNIPTLASSLYPTIENTNIPTIDPTNIPTLTSSLYPTIDNTNMPSVNPTSTSSSVPSLPAIKNTNSLTINRTTTPTLKPILYSTMNMTNIQSKVDPMINSTSVTYDSGSTSPNIDETYSIFNRENNTIYGNVSYNAEVGEKEILKTPYSSPEFIPTNSTEDTGSATSEFWMTGGIAALSSFITVSIIFAAFIFIKRNKDKPRSVAADEVIQDRLESISSDDEESNAQSTNVTSIENIQSLDKQPNTSTKPDDSMSNVSSLELIDVFVPPGKLGVIISTINGSPIIHDIRPSSVLNGKLHIGDALVAVNDNDVRPLTATQVSKLIAKGKDNATRKLTVLRTVY